MKVATFNLNGINVRLPVLFRWLVEAKPDNDRARLDERKVSKSGAATESLCAFLANARQVGTVRRSWQGERRVPAASSYADTGLQPYSNKAQNGIKMGIHRAFRHQLP